MIRLERGFRFTIYYFSFTNILIFQLYGGSWGEKVCACKCRYLRGQKTALGHLELEIPAAVSLFIWVLGTKLGPLQD